MTSNIHFFFDGYAIDTETLSSVENMRTLLDKINKLFFDGKGVIKLIPYFNGKFKEDGGVSGIVLGNNSHFTCHTFCYKNTMFVDYYGNNNLFEQVKSVLLKIYPTDDFDLCDKFKNQDGNFGKHIILNDIDILSFEDAKELVSKILTDINMTPINEKIINYNDDKHFDILQPIAESHISIHRNDEKIVLDVFSCKWFDEDKLFELVNSSNYDKICRGIRFK